MVVKTYEGVRAKRATGVWGLAPRNARLMFFLGASPQTPVARFARAWRHAGEDIRRRSSEASHGGSGGRAPQERAIDVLPGMGRGGGWGVWGTASP
jgi:hypothetical protein